MEEGNFSGGDGEWAEAVFLLFFGGLNDDDSAVVVYFKARP